MKNALVQIEFCSFLLYLHVQNKTKLNKTLQHVNWFKGMHEKDWEGVKNTKIVSWAVGWGSSDPEHDKLLHTLRSLLEC